MAVLITEQNCDAHQDLLEQAYRFRHRHFVERLGWEAIRRPDGREVDQFDGPQCVHAIGTEAGSIIHYVRLLPTDRPHLQSHVYPEILQGNPSRTGPAIYEWTRGSVDPAKRGELRGADPTTGAFYVSVVEACLALGIEGLLVQTHPQIMARIMELGWAVEPLALPTDYQGHTLVPIYAGLTPDTLATSRRMFGLTEPVLGELPAGLPERGRPGRPLHVN
jgi:acyl-homoserine lactone synthase